MPARKRRGEEERREAIKVALSGIAGGGDLGGLVFELRQLHPRNNTFPGEVLLELAADAIEQAGASRSDPIDYEDIRERVSCSSRSYNGPAGTSRHRHPSAGQQTSCDLRF